MDRNELKGRVAVVLGADGVGAAVCRLLAARGARIAVVGEDAEELQDIVEELRWLGSDTIGVLSAGIGAAAAHAGVLDAVGAPDLLFVTSGPGRTGESEEHILDGSPAWRVTVDNGLSGPFEALRTFVPRMVEARRGAIVALAPFGTNAVPPSSTVTAGGGSARAGGSSARTGGVSAPEGRDGVASSKARGGGSVATGAAISVVGGGVTALTHHVARDVAAAGVRANVVSWTPGLTPVEDAAAAAVYLACDTGAGVTGTTLDVRAAVRQP